MRVLGGGFKAPPDPRDQEVTGGALQDTVAVYFGASRADWVAVVNDALMYVRVPKTPLYNAKTGSGAGVVDLVVQNLDSEGVLIPGEEVTVAGAFTYVPAKLTAQSDLLRVIRQLVILMRKEIIREVVLSEHTDYDADTADGLNIAMTAKLPALALIGPNLSLNPESTNNQGDAQQLSDGTVILHRQAHTVNVGFQVVGLANKMSHKVNLQSLCVDFFRRNAMLQVQKDPADPSAGVVEYQLFVDIQGDPRAVWTPNPSNVRSFTMSVTIVGVDILGVPGLSPLQTAAHTLTAQVQEALLDLRTV